MRNILFVTGALNYGGGPKRLQLIHELLLGQGVKTDLFTLQSSLKQQDEKKVPNLFCPGINNGLFGLIKATYHINKLLRKHRYQVVVCNSRRLYVICKLFSLIYRVKYVNLVQIVYNKTAPLFRLFFSKNIVAVSEGVKSYLITKQKVPQEHVTVIRNSSIPLQLLPYMQQVIVKKEVGVTDEFIISCVAWFSPVKGHVFLLQAFRHLQNKNRNTKLLLMGFGEYKKEIEDEVSRLGVQNNVVFINPNFGVEKIVSITDLLVLPSLREGLPTIVLEGFSLGKTIVATDIPGTNEIVKDGFNGLLVPTKDSQSLELAIDKLITNNEFRAILEKNAKKTYENYFSFDLYQKQVIDYFEKLIQHKQTKL